MSLFFYFLLSLVFVACYFLIFRVPKDNQTYDVGRQLYYACLEENITLVREILNQQSIDNINPDYVAFVFDGLYSHPNTKKIEVLKLMLEKEAIVRHMDFPYTFSRILDIKQYDIAKKLILSDRLSLTTDYSTMILQKIILTHDEELYSLVVQRKDFDPSFDEHIFFSYCVSLDYEDVLTSLLEKVILPRDVLEKLIELAERKNHKNIKSILERYN